MQKGRAERYLTAIGFVVVTSLLLFAVVQLNAVEERLAVQGRQIRALGEATDRLLSQAPRGPGTGHATSSEPPPDDAPTHVLHPEVPNFLKQKGLHWPAPGATPGGVLRRGIWTGDPKGFNDLLEVSQDVQEYFDPVGGATIADRNNWTDPDSWYGILASRVEVTDDGKEFTIYLRKGAKWHPPVVDLNNPRYAWLRGEHEVTAPDFVFALDLIANPQVANGFLKNYYKELESWKALDDYTLVVRWKKKQFVNVEWTLLLIPAPRFLYAFDESGKPFPKETLGLRFNQHWYNNKGYMGAGPYRMALYEPGSRIRFVRHEGFIGEKPAIEAVEFAIYTDPSQTLLKLKAHELSEGILKAGQYREEIEPYQHGAPPPKDNPFFDGRVHCQRAPRFSYDYVAWNANRPLFADKRVRRAMTYALNRRQIVDGVLAGLAKIAVGPYEADSPANDPSIQPLPFDLGEARRLLESAGYRDTDGDGILDKEREPGDKKREPFEFTLLIQASSKELGAIANIYKEDLLKIGVKMNIEAVEWSLIQKRMEEKSFDAYVLGWGTTWDEDLYQVWHSSQADVPNGSNRIGFRNKDADALIEKLRVTFDPEERLRIFHAFHRLVHEEQPYTFLVSRKDFVCVWNDVKDVVFSKVRPAINPLPWSMAGGSP